jgi:hypothetical protein
MTATATRRNGAPASTDLARRIEQDRKRLAKLSQAALLEEANACHDRAIHTLRQGVRAALQAGEALLALKAKVREAGAGK